MVPSVSPEDTITITAYAGIGISSLVTPKVITRAPIPRGSNMKLESETVPIQILG